MYGFKSKRVAEDLRDFATQGDQFNPNVSRRDAGLREDNTKLVRVFVGSDNYGGSNLITTGITSGEDNTEVTHTDNEYLGKYLLDYCKAHEILFGPADTTDVIQEHDHLLTYLKPTHDHVVAGGNGLSGDLTERSELIVQNASIVPLYSGQIILVHKIGRRWVYCGSHLVTGQTQSSGPISAGTRGDVTIHVWPQTGTAGSSTFNFDAAGVQASSGITVSAYNYWTTEIPEDKRCLVGDVGGRLSIIGWEC